MAFPLLILQLGLWREYLFRRAEIEDPAFMPREDLDRQRGPVKIFAAAKLCGFLIATTLRKRLLRSLEQFGSPRAAKLVAEAGWQKDVRGIHPVDPALHDLLLAGSTDYTKYARENRRQLVERVKNNVGGTVVVIGERGIGKGGFMRQVCEAAAVNYVTIDCQSGSATAMEAELAAALDLTVPLDNRVILAEAFERKQVQVIAILNLHMLVRPVVGGFNEFNRMSAIMDLLPTGVMHLMGMDRYAWFYVKAALAERSASVDRIELQEWSEEHIRELIVRRCEEAGIKVDFTRVRVPSEYLDGDASTLEERNRIGVTLMCAVLAGGNPSIAMRLFVRCLRADDAGRLFATLPANLDAGQLDGASLHLLLLLRVVAQAERITEAQLHDNLRYPVGVIQNALQLAITREWIVEDEGHYSLSWQWFRTITRVLARHNLLAGVRQEV
jgi:hypothetical protein